MKTQTAPGIKQGVCRSASRRSIRGGEFSSRHGLAGLTFNELMIVISVAAVLAALAIFSTGTLVMRTKYSRVQEDHRVLTRALENYMMDYSNLPDSTGGLDSLERPTAYMAQIPGDPFHRGEKANYQYMRLDIPGIAFVLVSTGPDGDYDIPNELRGYTSLPKDEFGSVPVETLRVAGLRAQPQAVNSRPIDKEEAAFWSTLGLDGPPRDPSLEPEEKPETSAPEQATLAEFEEAILEYYLQNKSWSPDSSSTDGDIITVVRF
ncbi:type II secretion system protein GspG [bacterium]|nr:type II secretion system protein GspG [bacterium]